MNVYGSHRDAELSGDKLYRVVVNCASGNTILEQVVSNSRVIEERSWYPSGQLKTEKKGGNSKEYSRDGKLVCHRRRFGHLYIEDNYGERSIYMEGSCVFRVSDIAIKFFEKEYLIEESFLFVDGII